MHHVELVIPLSNPGSLQKHPGYVYTWTKQNVVHFHPGELPSNGALPLVVWLIPIKFRPPFPTLELCLSKCHNGRRGEINPAQELLEVP